MSLGQTADVALREGMRWVNDYYLWGVGAIVATLSLYLLLRQSFPKTASIVRWPVRACWWICGLAPRIIRWGWRQAWLQKVDAGPPAVWVSRGPITRSRERMYRFFSGIVDDRTGPQFEATRATARAQHDDQNLRFDAFGEQLTSVDLRLQTIEGQAQSATEARLADIEGRVRVIEDDLTTPTKTGRKATTTKGDGT